MQSLCTSLNEDLMATRNDTNDQNKAADEAARTARVVTDGTARVGEQTARAGADVFPPQHRDRTRERKQSGLEHGHADLPAHDGSVHPGCWASTARKLRNWPAARPRTFRL